MNDAFGTAHRAHASTEGVSHHVKTSVAGLLMEKELRYLGMALEAPERPFVAVLGGAKVSDKIQVIESLLPRVDALLVGGGMAYTFFQAQGLATGKSLVEEDKVALAKELCWRKASGKIHLPVDHVVAAAFKADAEQQDLPAARRCPRAGWASTSARRRAGRSANKAARREDRALERPHGRLRDDALRRGHAGHGPGPGRQPGHRRSWAAATAWPRSRRWALADKIDHVSTGGGASLEFLSGEPLPGVACLKRRALGPMRRYADRRQLEDVQDGARGRRAGQRAPRRDLSGADVEVVLGPPFTALHAVAGAV